MHVCRAWRQTIFDSPLRLNLQIPRTFGTPVKKYLGIWPNLPIAVDYCRSHTDLRTYDEENAIYALEYPDRVVHIGLNSYLQKLATVIQKPFPVLKSLIIFAPGRFGGDPLILPANFLGGSAPRLQKIYLVGVVFPTLPNFLLSASDLVELILHDILPTSFIPPEAMTACLVKLPKLKNLWIEFNPTSHSDQIPLSSITRTVLPALTHFRFHGHSEYLENLMSRIVCSRLDSVILYYDDLQLADLRVVQLSMFFYLSLGPGVFTHAQASFDIWGVSFDLYPLTACTSGDWRPVTAVISCMGIGWGASRVLLALSIFSVLLSTAVHFRLIADSHLSLGNVDDLEWLHLLHQFPAVRALYISRQIAELIVSALISFSGEMVAEALQSLDLICLEHQPTSYIDKFISLRRLSGRPITAVSAKDEFDQTLNSYNKN